MRGFGVLWGHRGGDTHRDAAAPPPAARPVISKAPRGFPLLTSERKRCPGPGASGGGTGRPRAPGRHGVSPGCHGAPRGAQGVTEKPPALWSLRCHRPSPRCHGAASGPAGSVVSSPGGGCRAPSPKGPPQPYRGHPIPHPVPPPRSPLTQFLAPVAPTGGTQLSLGGTPLPSGNPMSSRGNPMSLWGHPFPNGGDTSPTTIPVSHWGHPISPRGHPIPQGAPPHSPRGHPISHRGRPLPTTTPPPILTPFPFCVPPQARWRCPPDPCGATRKASAESSSAATWR